MAVQERTAQVNWNGNFANGTGTVTVATGALPAFPVSWPSRSGDPDGKTSPEELLAAAEAACYSMKLAAELGRAGSPPDELDVSATVTLDLDKGGISTVAIHVRGRVPGIDASRFQELAELAKTDCPVSKALSAVGDFRLEASLA
jgi:osmotically inducible protein OsmC